MISEPCSVYEFGAFHLDSVERSLHRDGKFLPLATQVFDILLLLLQRHGEVVTKDELMRAVWPGAFVEENNLTVRMSALRKALGRDAQGRRYVETVHGRGYRFVGRVRRVADPAPWHAAPAWGSGGPGAYAAAEAPAICLQCFRANAAGKDAPAGAGSHSEAA